MRPGSLLTAYRRAGADLPFADPRRDHGAGMEGYYWRITDAAAGRVVIALCGVCRAPDGRWATVALAAHPEGIVRWALAPRAEADPRRLGVAAGDALAGCEQRLRVSLGRDARLDVRFAERVSWPRRALGGSGPAQLLPGLDQYWHPHLLAARVEGEARLGASTVSLSGATAYAEKNWGAAFSTHWWWGQAQAFPQAAEVCVAFAGGRMRLAGATVAPTALAVRLGDHVLALRPPLVRVAAAVGRDGWRVRARSARHAVELEGDGNGIPPCLLPVPVPGRRDAELRSHQVLAGRLAVRVRRGRRTLFAGESRLAGLERPAFG